MRPGTISAFVGNVGVMEKGEGSAPQTPVAALAHAVLGCDLKTARRLMALVREAVEAGELEGWPSFPDQGNVAE